MLLRYVCARTACHLRELPDTLMTHHVLRQMATSSRGTYALAPGLPFIFSHVYSIEIGDLTLSISNTHLARVGCFAILAKAFQKTPIALAHESPLQYYKNTRIAPRGVSADTVFLREAALPATRRVHPPCISCTSMLLGGRRSCSSTTVIYSPISAKNTRRHLTPHLT